MGQKEKDTSSLLDRLRARIDWEIALYGVLIVIALWLRLWALGDRVISFDEFENIWWGGAWDIYHNHAYSHNFITHGPFQGYVGALTFWIFGDSDITTRIPAVFFGTALVALPFFLRRQLGQVGALCVATLFTFSPMLLYFSRYARTDIYVVFWMMLLVVCIWRYIEESKPRYLYIGAAALSLSFCTKEVTFFAAVIFAGFLFIKSAPELWRRVRSGFNLKGLSPYADYFILIATLALPLYSAGVGLIPGVHLDDPGIRENARLLKDPAALAVLLSFSGISAAIGLRWNWRRWLASALIFYGIFTLLYTTFFTNPAGFSSGIWGTFDYWIGQAKRVTQPWFYYIMLMPIYEFLPLLFAAIAIIYYAVKEKLFYRGGNLFIRFLILWMLVNLIAYSSYGEKMPQISLNVVVPATILAGMFIGRILQALDWRWAKPWVARVVPSMVGVEEAAEVPSKKSSRKAARKARRKAALGGGKPRPAHAMMLLVLVLLFSYTLRVSFQANYHANDDRPEMLYYAHISFDTREIVAKIEDYAEKTGKGKELPISEDSSEGAFSFFWSWAWYNRNYPRLERIDCSNLTKEPAGDVLLIKKKHVESAQPYLGKYGEGQEFRHMLWFTEQYKTDKFSDNLKAWWTYFFNRRGDNPWWGDENTGIVSYWGSGTEGVIYFLKGTP
jgi:uncharacterized protein (TIGR03663 family)